MSTLQNTLDRLDAAIEELRKEKVKAIGDAPRDFVHLADGHGYLMGRDRYVIIRADGHRLAPQAVYAQRPAAERYLRMYARVYHDNIYMLDGKDNHIYDVEGKVVR